MIINNPIDPIDWAFTNSQVSLFKNCRQKYWYSYIELLQPNIIVKPLFIGSLVHDGIALYYKLKKTGTEIDEIYNKIEGEIGILVDNKRKELDQAYENVNEVMDQEISDMEDLCLGILDNYIQFAELHDNWDIVIPEQEFEFQVAGVTVKFKVDGVVKREDGTNWLLEHKTTIAKDFTDYKKKLELDDQVCLYLTGINQIHPEWKVKGVIYNILRKKVPSVPKICKNGAISKAACDTTYEIFKDTIDKNKLNQEDYIDVLNKLKYNEFVHREQIFRTPEFLSDFMANWTDTLKALTSPKMLIYKNPWSCKNFNCSYHSLCVEDTQEIREFNFHKRDRANIELDDKAEKLEDII